MKFKDIYFHKQGIVDINSCSICVQCAHGGSWSPYDFCESSLDNICVVAHLFIYSYSADVGYQAKCCRIMSYCSTWSTAWSLGRWSTDVTVRSFCCNVCRADREKSFLSDVFYIFTRYRFDSALFNFSLLLWCKSCSYFGVQDRLAYRQIKSLRFQVSAHVASDPL